MNRLGQHGKTLTRRIGQWRAEELLTVQALRCCVLTIGVLRKYAENLAASPAFRSSFLERRWISMSDTPDLRLGLDSARGTVWLLLGRTVHFGGFRIIFPRSNGTTLVDDSTMKIRNFIYIAETPYIYNLWKKSFSSSSETIITSCYVRDWVEPFRWLLRFLVT